MKKGITSWKNLLRFVNYYFSIQGLLATLFVPWRQEQYSSDQSGIWKYLEQGVFYVFAVLFGLIIRGATIILGVLCLLVVILLFPLFLILPINLSFEKMSRAGSLGRDWSYAHTWELNKHGKDLRISNDVLVLDHDKAIEQIERILARKTQQNVLLVGSQGIGKTTRLAHLARNMHRDLSTPSLNGKRLFQLFPEEMSIEDIQVCIKEAVKAKNIVLVIENIERFNILGVIAPYLDEDNFQIILTSEWSAYNSTFKHNSNLMRAAEVVEMYPPNAEVTLAYAQDWVEKNKESKRFKEGVLETIIKLTDMLMMNQDQPEKTIDILDELSSLETKDITVAHVEALISQKTKVPLGALGRDEKDLLLNLERVLKQHVIGQDRAVHAIASSLKRSRVGVSDSPKPIGSFLFLGPTGVGKTYTAKMLARYYFGGEQSMIRFDMSEFRELNSLSRFVERLANRVEESPFALVFFDEIEKAHPDILNIFLQILDEGEFHTQTGRTISFRNTIIICTSNAGATFMMENEHESEQFLIQHIISTGLLRPEFINRFDASIMYTSLVRSDIQKVAVLLMNKLNRQLRKKHFIEVIVTDALIKALARAGHSTQFGLRPLARVIQDSIETEIADRLLAGVVPKNYCIYINPDIIKKT